MKRRTFIKGTGAFTAALSAGLSACQSGAAGEETTRLNRIHPLEGIERENIRITDVVVTPLSCPVPPEEQWYLDWIPERYRCWKTDSVLVEVFTDAGITGIGGCTQYGVPEQIVRYVNSTVKPALIGQNPFDVEYLTCGVARRGAMVGWAGVDAALWDIIGKAKGLPVYRLLSIDGEPQPAVPVYASAGEMYDGDVWPDNIIAEALEMKAEGFTAYKFRPGTHWSLTGMTMSKYTEGLRRIRDAVGPDFALIQECNAQWTVEQTLELIPVVEALGFLWIEDPIRRVGPQAIDNHRLLHERLDRVLLSYGGDVMDNRFDYKPWIDSDAIDIVQPDAGVMGLTEAWFVSRMAALRGQRCAPHNWHGGLLTMANAAMAAAIPNLILLEVGRTYNPLREEIFQEPLTVENGVMQLPDKPGFGVELIPDVAKKFPYIEGRYDLPPPEK